MNIPRLTPIDTSVYSFMMKMKDQKSNPIKLIRNVISKVTGVDPYVDQKWRDSSHVQSRQLFLYFVRKATNLTQTQVGQLVGKDHASVNHAERCVEKWLSLENKYKSTFNKISDELKSYKLL